MYTYKHFFNLLIVFSLSLSFGCNTLKSQTKAPAAATELDPYMTFETPLHDFGTIKKGESRTHVFKFTNTGKEDITIELVSGCDCTEITSPEGETFKPGESGTITATFHSNREEDMGEMEKVIDILLTNVDPKTGYQIIKEAKYKLNLVK